MLIIRCSKADYLANTADVIEHRRMCLQFLTYPYRTCLSCRYPRFPNEQYMAMGNRRAPACWRCTQWPLVRSAALWYFALTLVLMLLLPYLKPLNCDEYHELIYCGGEPRITAGTNSGTWSLVSAIESDCKELYCTNNCGDKDTVMLVVGNLVASVRSMLCSAESSNVMVFEYHRLWRAFLFSHRPAVSAH